MAQDIVGNLFGLSAGDVLQQRVASEAADATQFANLNPEQRANYGMYMAGRMGGRAVSGLMGAEDPRLVQARQMDQVKQWIAQSGIDMNTPEGLAQAAQYAQSIGATEGAMYLGQQSMQLRKQAIELGKSQEDLQRGQEYRAKVAELNANPNATEEDYIKLQRQYTSPEAGITASINLMSKREQAEAKAEQKAQFDAEKQRQAADLAFGRASVITTAAQEAYNMVNGRTAGPLGQQLRAIGGTSAADLESKLTTIKSLLAVSELQKIREASKTGGALGNVSNKDIDLLQSTVANLDQKQSPEQLKSSIEKVFTLYNKILQDAGLSSGQTVQTTQQAAPAKVDTTGWSVVTTK